MYHNLKIVENTPSLETERLILRRFEEGDLKSFFDLMRDEEVNTFLPWYPTNTLDQAAEMLKEKFTSLYEDPGAYHYAVCRKSDNLAIGYVNLSDDDSRDFGYGLLKEFWHQGIVTEAADAVMGRIREAGIAYITATHDRNNPRSGGVMRNLGMKYQYSYEERWQPKNNQVVFRLYQMNFDESDFTYMKYWNQHPNHFVEVIHEQE